MGLSEKMKKIFGVEYDDPDNVFYTHMMEGLELGNGTEIEMWMIRKQVSQLIRDNCSSYKEPEDE